MIRATSEDHSLRDSKQALQLATTACDLTGHEHPEALYVLRAACADVGRFPEAVFAAELGIRAARRRRRGFGRLNPATA